jgi:hypothetical protein
MTPQEQFAERHNILELLRANYDILSGIVRRWAVWERAGAMEFLRRSPLAPLAVELAGDTIPYLRRRLGLEPDPDLVSLLAGIRALWFIPT